MSSALLNRPKRPIRSYVRRQGRMTPAQKAAWSGLASKYVVSCETKSILDWQHLFPTPQPLVLEIGFGMGENLTHLARQNPDYNFIGIDVHQPGVGACCIQCANQGLNNVRLVCQDAIEVLKYAIADSSLEKVFILFPDPWPKKKHHKRRIIQEPLINLLSQKITPNGFLYIMTDWEPYAEHIQEVMHNTEKFIDVSTAHTEFSLNRIQTKFEKKGLNKGHKIFSAVYSKGR